MAGYFCAMDSSRVATATADLPVFEEENVQVYLVFTNKEDAERVAAKRDYLRVEEFLWPPSIQPLKRGGS